MPKFEVTFSDLPAGYAAEFHPKGKLGSVNIELAGFRTTDEGEMLVTLLEGISSSFLTKVPAPERPDEPSIRSFLGIVRKDKTATIHINDLVCQATVIPKRTVVAGGVVYVDDIVDVMRMQLKDISIPDDAGFALIMSQGWRRALLFDYAPLHPQLGGGSRSFDIEAALAQVWAYLVLRDRLFVTDKQWKAFFAEQWFPFSSLSKKLIKQMKSHADHDHPIAALESDIHQEVLARCSILRNTLETSKELEDHRGILLKAIEHFQSGDLVSTSAMLYPRIEGVLRTWHGRVASGKRATQEELTKSAGTALTGRPITSAGLLLVDKFQAFLQTVYFANFDPSNPSSVSRNTIGHGVAPMDKLDLKAACLAILILEQLVFLMGAGKFETMDMKVDSPVKSGTTD